MIWGNSHVFNMGYRALCEVTWRHFHHFGQPSVINQVYMVKNRELTKMMKLLHGQQCEA